MLVLIFALTVKLFPIGYAGGQDQLNFNYHHQIIFSFQLPFTRMIISRLFFGLARPSLTSQLSAAFAYANSTRTYSNIRSKIQSSRSFGEFFELLQNKRSEINILDICSSSKHINGLINVRQRIEIKHVQSLISYIQKCDLAGLTVRNLLNILVVFRNLKGKRIFLDQLQTLKNKIAVQAGTLIKQKNYREDEAHELSGAYFEFSKQKIYGEAKMVADKLLAILEEGIKSDRVIFNNSELSFIIVSLSLRPNPTNKQTRIRQIILDRLSKQSDVLPIEQLVKIVSCLAKIQSYDFKNDQFSNIRQLVQKVTDRTDELDENQLLDLIRAKSSAKLPGYVDFLQKIRNNIFEAISLEGKSQIDNDAVFKVLPILASKVTLRDDDKNKMVAFLENFAQTCKNDPKKFSLKTLDFVTNQSFDFKIKQAFSKILEKYDFQVTVNMMYYMALNRFNIEYFAKQLSQFTLEKLTKQYIYKLGFISYKISKGQSDILPIWEKLHAIIAEDFSTPQKFMETIKFFSRGETKFEDLSEMILPQFGTLPNPFQAEAVSGAYPFYYTQFILKNWKNKDVFQFLTKHEAKIRISDLLKISSQMIEQEQQSTSYSRPLISILSKRSNEIIDSKNTKDISSFINLIGKFNRIVIYSQIDSYSENNIFKILRNFQYKIKTLEEISLDGLYYSILEKYICRSGSNYNYQHNFKNFIRYLLNHISEIKKAKIQSQIIEEGLALDFVNKKHLESIDLQKIYLPYFSKTRALFIKDPTYTPDLTRFTNNSLEIILTNPNLQKYIQANYNTIVEKIKTLDANQAVYFVSIYNIHKSAYSRKIMFELLNVIVEKLKNSNKCNILGMFENAVNNNYFTFFQYKKIALKVVEDFKKYFYSFSIESHSELIRFLITQPGMNDEEYFTKIVQYFQRKDDTSENSLDQLYNRLSTTNYKFKQTQLKSIQRLAKSNISSALHLFCMTEQLISQENRSVYVKQIVEKLTQNLVKEPEQRYNSTYLKYLKKVYPQETATLNVPEEKTYNERISFKPSEEFLNYLNKISGNAVQEVTSYGTENYIVKIKENIIVFITARKLGSYYDHEFIKRSISHFQQKPINVVCVSVGQSTANVIEFINKQCPNTFDEKIVQTLVQEIKNKKASTKKRQDSHQE